MKIITWNVNSIRLRLERLGALLAREQPDLVCLQELKCTDDAFPHPAVQALGYRAEVFGQKGYNGVALLSRLELSGVQRGFAGDPTPGDARLLAGSLGTHRRTAPPLPGLRVACVYVINGQAVTSPKYQLKLEWLDALLRWLEREGSPSSALLLCGDFNICPDDRDVWSPELWKGQVLCSEPERYRLKALLRWGLLDLQRQLSEAPGLYTFWDYGLRCYERDRGLRLDLLLGTRAVAERVREVRVDRGERQARPDSKPSDHAPVILLLED
jgi:exodeoxyribonuclease III